LDALLLRLNVEIHEMWASEIGVDIDRIDIIDS